MTPEKQRAKDQKRWADPEYRARAIARNAARSRFLVTGYDVETYDRYTREQDGKCFLCGGVNANGRALAADHCHSTNVPRRLLCMRCNAALGSFGDDIELMKRAIDYVYNFRMAAAVPILCGV